MTTSFISKLSIGAVVSMLAIAPAAAQSIAGTWEFNVAKSKSTDPLFKSHTRVYEVTGQQETMTGTGVNAQGQPINFKFTASLDGKDQPFQFPGADAIVLTPVDAWTVNFVNKKAGQVVVSGTRVISKDGKIMTIVSKGTNPAGNPLDAIWVFDKR